MCLPCMCFLQLQCAMSSPGHRIAQLCRPFEKNKMCKSLFSVPARLQVNLQTWSAKFSCWLGLEAGQLFILLLMECYWHHFNETALMSADSSDSPPPGSGGSTVYRKQRAPPAARSRRRPPQEPEVLQQIDSPCHFLFLLPVNMKLEFSNIVLHVNDHICMEIYLFIIIIITI